MRYTILAIFLFVALGSCKRNACDIPDEITRIPVDIKPERLEVPFFQLKSKPQIRQFLDQHPAFSETYLQRSRYPQDSLLVNSLYRLATDTALSRLVRFTEKKFGKGEKLEQELELAFKHVKHYYPDFRLPKVQTFISGFSTDLVYKDSLLVISLENFLGAGAPYRPQLPSYMLRRYVPEGIAPAAVLALSNRYNKTDFLNRTLLAEMVYYGKAYYFVTQMLPCTPDSIIMGYSGQQIADSYFNQDLIWAHFVEKKLLYETSHFKIQKYVGERPTVPEVGDKCPGRIGQWVGLQIVRQYMEKHPEVTLQQLMAEPDPQKIFSQSNYKPKKKR